VRYLIAFILFALSSPAAARWQKAESDNFIVYSELGDKRLSDFVKRLEAFATFMEMRVNAQIDPATPKLLVFAVRDQESVQRAMGKGSTNVAGFYNANITGALAFVPLGDDDADERYLNSEIVLFHEYAHHFMLQHYPQGFPAWFVEGFAEFYSTTEFKRDGSINIGMPASHRGYTLSEDNPIPMARMLAADPGKMNDQETYRFYAWSWATTHYLLTDPARKGQLNTYLKAFSAGSDPVETAKAAFGDLDSLKKDVSRHALAARISIRTLRGWTPPEPKITVTALDDVTTQSMPLFMRFVQGTRDEKEAETFVQSARALTARYPNQPAPLELLAEGELDVEAFDAATKANEQLLVLRPNDARALLRRARIASGQQAKTSYPGGWAAIRKLIVKANRMAPNDPFPLSEYFNSFEAESMAPSQTAAEGLRRALELAPQVTSLRLNYANWLIFNKKRDEARVVLSPLLNHPHNPELRTTARTMLDGSVTPGEEGNEKADKTPEK
jgi:hypothetical protein